MGETDKHMNERRTSMQELDSASIDEALDLADQLAEETDQRLTHKQVFQKVRQGHTNTHTKPQS